MFIEKTLGQLCELGEGKIQTGPFGSQLHQADYSEEGTPVVMPADIIDGKISETKIARVSEDHVMRLERHQLAIGDIVYGRRGDIGRQALITSKEEGWLCGTGCLRVTVGKKSPIDPEYLHLYLKMPDVISYIQNQAIGATMPNLNTEILKRIPIRYPEKISDQKKVIAVLKAYFDLIEINKKRIQILENMAEELYKEWFVRFRFPNWENTEFEKGVPKGWSVVELKDIAVECSKSTKAGEHLENRYYLPLDVMSAKAFLPDDHYDYQEAQSSLVTFEKGEIIFGAMRPYQHKVNIAPFNGITRTTCFVIKPKNEHVFSFLYLLLFQKTTIDYAMLISNGADRPYAVWNRAFERLNLLLPTEDLLLSFNNLIKPMLDKILSFYFINRTLEETKNELLPRLISGKISVEDLDIQFPPSMQEQ